MLFRALCKALLWDEFSTTKTCQRLKLALMAMKLTAILLLTVAIQVSAKSFSQQLTFSLKNVPIENVFREIEKQTGYSFVYTQTEMSGARTVTMKVENAKLEDVLALCFKEQPLTYTLRNKFIVVKAKSRVPVNTIPEEMRLLPPLVDVRGRLVNERGDPVAGATVAVKGTAKATSTNSNGEFELKAVDEKATIVFSSTDIETIEIKLNGRRELFLSASKKISKLDEIQFIKYGITTQRYSTGSISKVSSAEIGRQPVANPLAALQGRVPGLIVSSTSGLPGAAFKIQIRGQNTLNPTTNNNVMPFDNPLIIIDGIPFAPNNRNVNQLNSLAAPGTASFYGNQYSGISPLTAINPADIESIEVLKDADATAIFGSRGANGVVMITTKKGQEGKLRVNTTVYKGVSRIGKTVELMNTREYREFRKEAIANDGRTPNMAADFDLLVFDSTKDTDWTEYFLGKSSSVTDAFTQLSGGSANTSFRLSANYREETYVMRGDFLDRRMGANFSLHHETPNKRFSLDLGANYTFQTNNSAGRSEALGNFTTLPNYPDFLDKDGNLVWSYKGVEISNNPMQYLKQGYKGRTYSLLTNMTINYKILDGLQFTTIMGYNTNSFDEVFMRPIKAMDPTFKSGVSVFGKRMSGIWTVEPRLEYKRTIGKGKLVLVGGSTIQKEFESSSEITGSGYTNDLLLQSLAGATVVEKSNIGEREFKYASLYGRINYILQSRYIADINLRRDYSSRFGPGKQVGNFGSVGLGWIFSETSLIRDHFNFLSYGKIRASYGTTGNDAISDYQFIDNWQPTYSSYQGSIGYNPINLYNPDFSWAVNKKLEIGTELEFLQGRLFFTLAWYRNRCGNQLLAYRLPFQTGFANVTMNQNATVENSGFDFVLTTQNVKKKGFNWTTSLNINIGRNKLIAFPGIETSSYANTYTVGESVNLRKLYHLLGVDPATGVFQYYSAANGKTVEPEHKTDRIINLDPATPKFTGGLNNSIRIGDFTFDIMLEFRKQVGATFRQSIYTGAPIGSRSTNLPKALLNHWRKPGDVSEFQKLTTGYSGDAYIAGMYFSTSDAAYGDASFIKVRNIALSYNLSRHLLKKLQWMDIQLFAYAQNLFTISRYQGSDPETQAYTNVPPVKTVVAGIKVNL